MSFIIPNEAVLTESPTARQQFGTRIDVLDKVRVIPLLPDDLHITTEGVAAYFDVAIEAVKSLVKDNRDELGTNGYRVLAGEELRSLKALCGLSSQARSLALFDRRTLLNVAMLLRDSEVARQVRRYLLDSEQAVRDIEEQALARREAGGPLCWTWSEACAIIRQRYGVDWNTATLRRRLRTAGILKQSLEPKAAYRSMFWFTGSAWEVHAHAVPELLRQAVEIDRQLREFDGIQMRLELDTLRRLPAVPSAPLT